MFSRQSAHIWRWGSQPYAPTTLYPQEDSWCSSLLEAESTPRAIVRLEGLGQLKNLMTLSGIEGKYKKLKLFLSLICYALCHEDICGSVGIAPPFLNSVLDGGEYSASRPSLFTPGETDTGTHWIGGWVGPRVGLEAVDKSLVLSGIEPGPPSPYLHRLHLQGTIANYAGTSVNVWGTKSVNLENAVTLIFHITTLLGCAAM
jgi:hypothetical protein